MSRSRNTRPAAAGPRRPISRSHFQPRRPADDPTPLLPYLVWACIVLWVCWQVLALAPNNG